MTPGERFKAWLEGLSEAWKDRVKGWLSGAIGFGIEVLLDVVAKKSAPALTPIIERAEATGKVPPELQGIFDEIKHPTGESAAAFGLGVHGPLVGGAISRIADAIMLPLSYAVNKGTRNVILNPQQLIELMYRKRMTREEVTEYIRWLGYTDEDIEHWLALYEVRLPSQVIGPVWLRDKAKWGKYWDDVRAGGITDDRVELLQEFAYQMPSVRDVVNFLAHEVFEPDMIQRYGLDDEWGALDKSLFDKVGLREDMALNYWRDHWKHPSWGEVTTMLHRGLLTEEQVYDWYRLVEIPPYWREKLTALSWDLPNRIELRMMARYGLVGKPFLVDVLKQIGLREDYRDVTADMMLAMGVRTDVATRYSKGWINKDGVKSELEKSGLSPQVVDRMYQWIVSNVQTERTSTERNLTKAEIVKGVRNQVITLEEGIAMLLEMGYDDFEARYIMAINIEVQTGSPHNLGDFKRLIDLYRAAQGLPTERKPDEILRAEKLVNQRYPYGLSSSPGPGQGAPPAAPKV